MLFLEMYSGRTFAVIAALIPLVALAVVIRDEPSPPSSITSLPSVPAPSAISSPTDRAAASLGITDLRALEHFHAKRDAKAFVHSYNTAIRVGAEGLDTITSPHEALSMLVRGVPGKGEIVHSFRQLTPAEIAAASALVTYRDGRMHTLPEADFTALEEELKSRAASCKFGACGTCIAEVRSGNRLRRSLADTVSLDRPRAP